MSVTMRQFRRLPIWLVLILLIGLIPPVEAAQASLLGSDFRGEALKERALEAYMYAQRKGTPLNYGKH